ncbi:hypothetical protein DL771_008127 [Monosporascus sp. 5C6A]|nr:hypothetical protein DL771_008127 [Monosporascus sp. 5C6A]
MLSGLFGSAQAALYIPFLVISSATLLYFVYRRALPKPLPGIPYDERARISLFGSFPEIREYVREHGRLRPWLAGHSARHNSALTQFWFGPFARPTLILSDFQETQDILLRRSREFDRAQRSCDFFEGPVGNHHIAMRTSDPRFKGNKELVKDLMTPAFLHEVSAPEIYAKATSLVDLWTLKAKLAAGRPFNADRDVFDAAVDIINAATFGLDDDLSTVKHQLDSLAEVGNAELPLSPDGSVKFAHPPDVPEIAAIHEVGVHIGEQIKTLFPKLSHRYKVLTKPSLSKAISMKDKFIHDEIEKALARLRSGGRVRSAMDHILQREMNAAKKADRPPVFHSPRIHDELFGYIIAGHDTSAAALKWTIKWVADEQEVQNKLRAALRTAYGAALSEGRQPSVTELWKTPVPYLDAVIEESLRVNGPLPNTQRETIVDTVILGHNIPKGTEIIFVGNGPSCLSPGVSVPDSARSESSRAKYSHGHWNPEDIHLFRPERWLRVDENGREVFDPQAGPTMPFSFGPRGCFGRRLAYLEIRIVLALLVWNFEFQKLSEELTSDTSPGLTLDPAINPVPTGDGSAAWAGGVPCVIRPPPRGRGGGNLEKRASILENG